MRVLYLDDEQDLCDIFAEIFTSETVKVVTYTEPMHAIDSVKSNPPDLIFLDYRLPGTTGDLVAIEMGTSIDKYLITGEIAVESKYAFIKIIKKPFDFSEIQKIIDQKSHH